MKIRQLFLMGLFLLGVLSTNWVQAQNAQPLTCVQNYYRFIFNVRSENTRQQGVKDAFTLSVCQLNDIFALDDELDQIRADFRRDATFCEDTSAYEKDYIRILMEMYFVRNVQPKSPGVLKEEDYEKIQNNRQGILDDLYAEMFQTFVIEESRVSSNTFKTYFEGWSLKYEEKIGSYARCEQGAWAELQETLDGFSETLGEIKVDVDKYERDTGLFDFKERVQASTDEDTQNLFNAIKSFSFKKKTQEDAVAELEPALTVQDFTSAGGLRLDQALDELESSELRFLIEARGAERMARYEKEYGEASAVTTTQIQNILKESNRTVETANIKHFPAIKSSLAKIYDRQCN